MLVDTHAHLNMSRFAEDRNQVIDRARAAGVEYIVDIGADLSGSRRAVELAHKCGLLRAAVGIHPHDAAGCDAETLAELRSLAADENVVAVGESGLDYHYDNSPREHQRRAFVEHIELARELGLPLIVHSREADADTVRTLQRNELPAGVLMHCFAGGREMARKCLEMDCYFAIGGVVTFHNASRLREIVGQEIPLERLVLETDAPYLAPEPHRGRRNEPAYIRHIAAKVAELKGKDREEIARITADNACRFFGIEG